MKFDVFDLINQIYPVYKILLAIFLGGIMGWQREVTGKSAGLRTYALVSAGSALFSHLSLTAFNGPTPLLAAQIVTGIGFLGAGIIMHKRDTIVGLTTAAGLWVCAAVGMAVGLGYYLLATIVAFLILIVLMIDDKKILDNHNVTKETKKKQPKLK